MYKPDKLRAPKVQPKIDLSYTQLPDGLFCAVSPVAAPNPKTILRNTVLAKSLAIDENWLASDAALKFFTGQWGMDEPRITPLAMAYAGHQFGGFSPQLGDGRAALIGEIVDGDHIRHDIHLKGSGTTPYSRNGDGKATLRAVLKEYIFSETLAALALPTTRSLAAIGTGEIVQRQKSHPGAILVRTARSHIRVGTFQYARLMPNKTAIKALADYTCARLYPNIDAPNPYQELLEIVIKKQANLVAGWMSFGFIHGVMNTDNMAISGETIDFGPCAFMEGFRADQVFSSIDHYGRYGWNKQAEMAHWNLIRFAESLLPLVHKDEDRAVEIAQATLAQYSGFFQTEFDALMAAKLGLKENLAATHQILTDTFALLAQGGGEALVDYTLFFWQVTQMAKGENEHAWLALFKHKDMAKSWLETWRANFDTSQAALEKMQSLNPINIPRFHQLETALEAAEQDDMAPFHRLLNAVTHPFSNQWPDLAKPQTQQGTQAQTFCET